MPPKFSLDKVVVEPVQIEDAPEIGESVVGGFTVNILVVELVHPFVLV